MMMKKQPLQLASSSREGYYHGVDHIQPPASRTSTISSVGVIRFDEPIDKIQHHRDAILKYHLQHRGLVHQTKSVKLNAGPNSIETYEGSVPYRLKAFSETVVRVPVAPESEFADGGVASEDGKSLGGATTNDPSPFGDLSPRKEHARKQQKLHKNNRLKLHGQEWNDSNRIPFKISTMVSFNTLDGPKMSKPAVRFSASLPGLANLTRRGLRTQKSTSSTDKLPEIKPSRAGKHQHNLRSTNALPSLKSQMWVMGISASGLNAEDDATARARQGHLEEMIAKRRMVDESSYNMYARKKRIQVAPRHYGTFSLSNKGARLRTLHGKQLSSKSLDMEYYSTTTADLEDVTSRRRASLTVEGHLGLHVNDVTSIGDDYDLTSAAE